MRGWRARARIQPRRARTPLPESLQQFWARLLAFGSAGGSGIDYWCDMVLVSVSRNDGSESVNGYLNDMGAGSFSLLGFCHFSATSLPYLLVRIPWRSIVFISRAQRRRRLGS